MLHPRFALVLLALSACDRPPAPSRRGSTVSAGSSALALDASVHDARAVAFSSLRLSLPTEARAAPDASALADAGPDGAVIAAASAREEDEAPSFSSPESLAELSRDPLWHPESEARDNPDDPLFCLTGTSYQSCVAEPCHDRVGEPCRASCARTCTGCDARCRTACSSCHRACRDDACRVACARTCGTCLDQCRTSKDRCVSGACARRESACSTAFAAGFNRSCIAHCQRCYDTCQSTHDDESTVRCVLRCARARCDRAQTAFCVAVGAVDPAGDAP